MTKINVIINISLSFLFRGISYLLGGFDTGIKVLIGVIIIDYITGLAKAIYLKNINSTIGLKGIIKKMGYLVIVALSVQIDKIIGIESVRTIVIYFFVANEGISILENWGLMGLPLPKKLINILEELKEK